jgi:cell division protein FtsW
MSASAQNAPAVNGAHQGWSRGVDPWLLVSALVLTGLGVIMVYSASSALAGKRYLDSAYFVKHQLVHVAVGFAVMAWLATQDYQRLRKLIWPVLILVFLALVAVLIPGVGHRAGGAARWLRLGFVSVQPAELAKLAMVLFLAHWLSRHQDRIKSLFVVFLPCLGVAGLLIGPILAEPDLGTSVMIMALTAVLLFAADRKSVV